MFHERSNVTASYTEHEKFQEQITLIHASLVNSGKPKQRNKKIRATYILKSLYIGCSTKEVISLLLSCEALKISRKNDFYKYALGK